MIYTKRNIKSRNLEYIQEISQVYHLEVAACEIMCGNEKLILCCVYRSPSGDIDTFFDKVQDLLAALCSLTRYFYIFGNFNINVHENNPISRKFKDILKSYNSTLLIDEATRITNEAALALIIVLQTVQQNHKGIINNIKTNGNPKNSSNTELITFRPTPLKSIETCIQTLLHLDWSELYSGKDIDITFNYFLNTLINRIDRKEFWQIINEPTKKYVPITISHLIQKSREMYRAVMKQVITYLEKAHHSLELLGTRMKRKNSVHRCKSEHQIVGESCRTPDISTISHGGSSTAERGQKSSKKPGFESENIVVKKLPTEDTQLKAFVVAASLSKKKPNVWSLILATLCRD
nr:unnamed protein product [Callosobruchus analis]